MTRHLFLDLDETMVSAIEWSNRKPPGQLENWSMDEDFQIYIRPGVANFLQQVSKVMPVSVWSAGSKGYVSAICSKSIQPHVSGGLKCMLWSSHCQQSLEKTGCLKSFDWLMKEIPCLENFGKPLLVDDLADNCKAGTSIQIKPFQILDPEATTDNQLDILLPQLIGLANKCQENEKLCLQNE